MNQTTVSIGSKDNQTQIRDIDVCELLVRGGYNYCILITIGYLRQFRLLQCFLSVFPIPFSWGFFHILQLLSDHLDPTLVDHLTPHLSAHPIKHPFQPSMSCGSQGSTVQRSSPHKCGQKSSCSVFNAVVAAFPQIFWVSFLFVCS